MAFRTRWCTATSIRATPAARPTPAAAACCSTGADCGLGHPLLDQAAFLSSIAEQKREPVRAAWAALWRDALPGCEPDRAAELLAPVAALRQALIYRTFLDGIEPDERVYHASDPGTWLRRAAELAGG